MCNYIKKCSDIVDWIFKPVAGVFLVILVISCIIQVFTRYVLNASMLWTEEVARYCFIWGNMLGAAILVKKKGHAVIDFFVKNLKGVAKRIQEALISVIILTASGVLIYYSILIMPVVARQTSPATGISMLYVYMSVPVGSVGILIHSLSDIFDTLLGVEKVGNDRKSEVRGVE